MSDGGAYSPFRSILLVLTHDFIITCVYGPTGSDGHERKDADAALRTIFVPFEAKGVLYAWGPVQPVNGRVPGSISSGLTLTLREDWSCKRALEAPCHARIATSPQDPTAMSPDHWSNLTWDTVFAGGYDL